MAIVARNPEVDPDITCIILTLDETILLALILRTEPELLLGNFRTAEDIKLRDDIMHGIRKTGLGV
jgi:hypothetical protein